MRHLVIAILASGALLAVQPAPYDLVLKNGRIVDGTGSSWFTGDVAIRGDAIAAVAPRDRRAGGTRDRRPRHASSRPASSTSTPTRVAGSPRCRPLPTTSRQGVTTVIEGPDGSSPLPLAPFLAQMDAAGEIGQHRQTFIGQGTIRTSVIGSVNRTATAEEIQKMVGLVEQGMKDGALGLSTGLFYVPGTFTPTDEVIELAKAAGRFGGIHESHQRDDAAKLLDSVSETIAIGEKGGLPTQISHAKVVGVAQLGTQRRHAARSSTQRGRAASTSPSISIPTPRRARACRRR